MVTTDTLEGTIDDILLYHYDMTNDVLYLRLTSHRDTPAVAEETPEGILLLRSEEDDIVVGITIVNWWKRFGHGTLPDSFKELEREIEPWAQKLAA